MEHCRAMSEQLERRLLFVNDVDLSQQANGVYRDNDPHSDPIELAANDGFIVGGWAISLNLGGSQHARFVPDTPFAKPPLIQEDPFLEPGEAPGDRFLIYFQDPLKPNERITIEPL
jgi:hypothetical protein